MNAWTGLLRKEFRLSRVSYFVGLIMIGILFAFAYAFSIRNGEPGFVVAVGALAIASHVLYLPLHVLGSLNTEGKQLHLWLHNPQSGIKLFSAKIIVSFIALIVSLAASLFIAYLGTTLKFDGESIYAQIISHPFFDQSILFSIGTWALVHLIAASIYLTIWVIFIWTVYNLFKSKIGKLSWLVAFLVFAIPNILFAKLQETNIYAWLTNWGKIRLNFLERFDPVPHVEYVYLGDYFIHIVIAIGLFLLSAWLIDKKVEV